MIDHELTDIYQEPEDYRGALMYLQERGYKLVTLSVSVTLDERSYVISHFPRSLAYPNYPSRKLDLIDASTRTP